MCLLLIAVLPASLASGCGADPAPRERPVPEVPAAEPAGDPLLEVRFGTGAGDERRGLRVRADGRYEYRGDIEFVPDADGVPRLESVELAWRTQWTYTPEQLAELRRAVARAAATTDSHYGNENVAGTRLEWRLHAGGAEHRIVVEGHPFTRAPELDRLLRLVFSLRRGPREVSSWRVFSRGRVVELDVGCEPREAPALRALARALYDELTEPPVDPPVVEDPPEGTPLVEVAYRTEDGDPIDRTRYWADGRRTEVVDGRERSLSPLSDNQVEAMRAAVARTDWAALPVPLC